MSIVRHPEVDRKTLSLADVKTATAWLAAWSPPSSSDDSSASAGTLESSGSSWTAATGAETVLQTTHEADASNAADTMGSSSGKSSFPRWAVYVCVGAGVAVLVALIFGATKLVETRRVKKTTCACSLRPRLRRSLTVRGSMQTSL